MQEVTKANSMKANEIRKRYDYYIGIDPGVKTGIAIYRTSDKTFTAIATSSIAQAFDTVVKLHRQATIHVRVEDARKRKFFGATGRERLQGAGSVKRDCSAWQEFLEYHGIPFDMPSPLQKGKKITADYFRKMTGYTGRSSQHGRDAALLVYGM